MSNIYEKSYQKELKEIAVSAIRRTPDESNPSRGDPDKDAEIKILAENIKQYGLLQPIWVVIQNEDSAPEQKLYDVVVGNRRLAAWKIAFPEEVNMNCFILPKDTTTARRDMLTVSENLIRLNYSGIDRARIIKKILPYWGNDRLRLAKALGFETAAVINDWLEMLDLEEDVLKTLKGPEGLIAKRARLIKKLPRAIQKNAAEYLNDNDIDPRRFVTLYGQNPTETTAKIGEMVKATPRTTSVMVSLSEPVNTALETASAKLRLTKSKVIERATERFLTEEQFLVG